MRPTNVCNSRGQLEVFNIKSDDFEKNNEIIKSFLGFLKYFRLKEQYKDAAKLLKFKTGLSTYPAIVWSYKLSSDPTDKSMPSQDGFILKFECKIYETFRLENGIIKKLEPKSIKLLKEISNTISVRWADYDSLSLLERILD